jgi:proteic killer suppression protein
MVISSFKHRGLKRFFEEDDSRKLPADMIIRIRAILTRLAAAEWIEDMDVHEYKLHQLKGDRKGVWSVRVRANWHITFRWDDGFAREVNFEDYH